MNHFHLVPLLFSKFLLTCAMLWRSIGSAKSELWNADVMYINLYTHGEAHTLAERLLAFV